MYIIRNDLTGKTWSARTGEARLYAIGGEMGCWYSVFAASGAPLPLTIFDLC